MDTAQAVPGARSGGLAAFHSARRPEVTQSGFQGGRGGWWDSVLTNMQVVWETLADEREGGSAIAGVAGAAPEARQPCPGGAGTQRSGPLPGGVTEVLAMKSEPQNVVPE